MVVLGFGNLIISHKKLKASIAITMWSDKHKCMLSEVTIGVFIEYKSEKYSIKPLVKG